MKLSAAAIIASTNAVSISLGNFRPGLVRANSLGDVDDGLMTNYLNDNKFGCFCRRLPDFFSYINDSDDAEMLELHRDNLGEVQFKSLGIDGACKSFMNGVSCFAARYGAGEAKQEFEFESPKAKDDEWGGYWPLSYYVDGCVGLNTAPNGTVNDRKVDLCKVFTQLYYHLKTKNFQTTIVMDEYIIPDSDLLETCNPNARKDPEDVGKWERCCDGEDHPNISVLNSLIEDKAEKCAGWM